MFFSILDAMMGADQGNFNVWCNFCTDL